ncbi:protein containing DUF115 [Sulfurimonas gotlandica GD1]|uniref:Protein containing DUF115 n=1 Tax=Sulfurimonas gotlandica (strain DSM 19862 / JCM 16533 / GD1) TaxID=929558 RepID=B6BGE5_SULGG|nr:6-hydroxymethylpterin diphosphokinase MptE-like protein [Sulfurimonas gotlandica]EDZ63665.1 conserved hypothetical protein [Sulfurimonas gotlandica GD1]EHP29572.1 protein containing DUF115 [Sulfurimonas gotlandica GD1]
MESIENQAISNYEKNMEYFSKEKKTLFNTINVFNHALENGDYTAQYDLEYINGYFDVKLIKSSNFLYARNSNDFSKELAKLVDFKKNTYTFEGFPVYNFSEEKLQNLDDMNSGLEGIYPLMTYYLENTKRDDEMKRIEKFIFVGTGLGFHIPLINDKIDADEYLFIEDDLELFRLSLFTTQYYKLAETSFLFFSVADDENLFLNTMKRFLHDTFFYNRFLKYSYFSAHSDDKIKQIQNALMAQSFASFPYKTELKKFTKPFELISDEYNILNLNNHYEDSIFNKKPVLIITAGPSFKKNIEWLKQNHTKFLVIAVSATLKRLYEHNIVPDILTHIDGFEDSMSHYDGVPVEEYLKNTTVILGPFALKKLRNMFPKENVFSYEENTEYFENHGFLITPCVGSFSLVISLIFNSQNVYLLGLDLALDQETGSSHADNDHVFYEESDMEKKDLLIDTMSLLKNVFPVKGNLRDVVYTTSILHLSVQSLYLTIKNVKRDDQNLYNLNDGAQINQAIPTPIEDVDTAIFESIDKSDLHNAIQNTLLSHSSNKLSEDDIISLKKRLEETRVIKKDIESYIKNVRHNNSNSFQYDLLGIVSDIIDKNGRETHNLAHVYQTYFKYIVPIVMDLFNTKGIKNEKRHIKKLDKLIQKELLLIVNTYEKAIVDFLEEKY